MTDRYAGYVVTLDQDMREDDAQHTIIALQQIKGVLEVTPLVATPEIHLAGARARNQILGKIIDAVKE